MMNIDKLKAAAEEFCSKVQSGEARSVKSYKAFRDALDEEAPEALAPDAARDALVTTVRVKAIHWHECFAEGDPLAHKYWLEFTEAVNALAAHPVAGEGRPVAFAWVDVEQWAAGEPMEDCFFRVEEDKPNEGDVLTPLYLAAPPAKADGEITRPYGKCSITGPAEDVSFIIRHLPDVD